MYICITGLLVKVQIGLRVSLIINIYHNQSQQYGQKVTSTLILIIILIIIFYYYHYYYHYYYYYYYYVRDFAKEGYFFIPRYEVWGVKAPLF